MKLDIIYRCCNAEVDSNSIRTHGVFPDGTPRPLRPAWFDKIKCLNTFINSVNLNSYYINKVIFLHDGVKGRLFDNIPKKFEIVEVNYSDNERSLLETFKIADSLYNNIYFVEDDYLHLPNSIKIIAEGVENFKLVTGYDHLDRYKRTDDLTFGQEYIAFSQKTNCHWRTAESTCCTWATTRDMWKNVVGDFAKTYRLQDRELFRGLNTEHNIRLWNPIPAVTTQVDINLSPGVNWEAL
jgi:hypothetical protein